MLRPRTAAKGPRQPGAQESRSSSLEVATPCLTKPSPLSRSWGIVLCPVTRTLLLLPAAAPRIVNISVLPGPSHAFRALCTAEGEPPPALSWSGPALGNSSAAVRDQGRGYQVTAELPALTRDGRYTCTAANSLGHAEASVYLFRFHGAPGGASTLALLLGALGLKALLLLGVLGARATRRRLGGCTPDLGGCEGEDRCPLLFLADHLAWHIRTSFLHPHQLGSFSACSPGGGTCWRLYAARKLSSAKYLALCSHTDGDPVLTAVEQVIF